MKVTFPPIASALSIGAALLFALPAEAQSGRYRGGYSGAYGYAPGGYRGGPAYGGYGRYGGYRPRGYGRYPRYGYAPRYPGYYGYGYPAPYGYRYYPRPYYGYGYYGGDAAAAIAGGLLGVAIGAAIAAPRYDRTQEYEDYRGPPPQPRTCPDGSVMRPDGYCVAPQAPPPESEYQPERGGR